MGFHLMISLTRVKIHNLDKKDQTFFFFIDQLQLGVNVLKSYYCSFNGNSFFYVMSKKQT